MHVAVVGAGALGRIYGARLCAAGERVSFVVRPSRANDHTPIRIESVSGKPSGQTVVDYPIRVTEVPPEADVVLVTVRFDQLDGVTTDGKDLGGLLAGLRRALIVVLTPLFPAQKQRLEANVGHSVISAMPGVSGYEDDRGVIRYWTPKLTSTLIDDPDRSVTPAARLSEERIVREQLARRLSEIGLPSRLERRVDRLNAATTVSFFPLIAAIAAGGGIDAALEDEELLELTMAAGEECDRLSRSIGKRASWANILTRFVGPFTLKAGVRLAKRSYPESVQFVDRHFGPKLHGQHIAMGQAISTLAKERGLETPALENMLRRLASAASD